MNLLRTKSLMYYYVTRNIPVALWGAPGIGKTEITYELARELPDTTIFVEALNLYESVDLRGLPRVDGSNVVWCVPEMFQRVRALAATHGRVILFLDEWNTAAESVMVCAAQLIHTRRVGPHELPSNVLIIAAGNEQSHRAAAKRTPSMLDNRLAHLFVKPSAKAWVAGAKAGKFAAHPMVIAYVEFMASGMAPAPSDPTWNVDLIIHDMRDSTAHAWPSSRSVTRVSEVVDTPDDVRRDLIAGIVGARWADSFESFLSTFSHVPKVVDIERDPNGAPVPSMSEPGLLWATAVTVSKGMTRANIGAMITYLERMPEDFAMSAILDATKRDSAKAKRTPADPSFQGLMQTPAFISWAARNADSAIGGDQ